MDKYFTLQNGIVACPFVRTARRHNRAEHQKKAAPFPVGGLADSMLSLS